MFGNPLFRANLFRLKKLGYAAFHQTSGNDDQPSVVPAKKPKRHRYAMLYLQPSDKCVKVPATLVHLAPRRFFLPPHKIKTPTSHMKPP